MHDWIQGQLGRLGLGCQLIDLRPMGGGCVNRAWEARTEKGYFFAKTNQPVDDSFFKHEIDGLEAIRRTGAIRVPRVMGHGYDEERRAAILVLEWVSGEKNERTEEKLGWNLAKMHQTIGHAFGWDKDNLIGRLPQPNGWMNEWIDFFRERRLRPQLELGIRMETITGKRRSQLERLIEQLDQWLDGRVQPSLLHGDLWGGNWIVGPQGEPFLIDPSVAFGHAEMDLAFTELFGGFSERFYRAYEEAHPLGPDYHDRKELYQLYYLLVHLNCFGETYGADVDRVLRRYV